jgi:ribosomal protein S18 acetylase RimI-like enzyme
MTTHASRDTPLVRILGVEPDEAERISQLAAEIWHRHYPGIISDAQIEYMLGQRYDPDRIRTELERNEAWWDKLLVDEAIAGFASSFVAADEPGDMKLDKLYVHGDYQRKGYGGHLIAHVAERARAMGLRRLSLAVNRHNANAIRAYLKYGFAVRSSRVLDIGSGFAMDDFLMSREL